MKKCAKCGAEYDDAYDGCPKCAAPMPVPKPGPIEILSAIWGLAFVAIGMLTYFFGGHDFISAMRWIFLGLLFGAPGMIARRTREQKRT